MSAIDEMPMASWRLASCSLEQLEAELSLMINHPVGVDHEVGAAMSGHAQRVELQGILESLDVGSGELGLRVKGAGSSIELTLNADAFLDGRYCPGVVEATFDGGCRLHLHRVTAQDYISGE